MKPIYVTGNAHKAKLFNSMVGIELEHERVDIEEIQSLDLLEVVEHKARAAYAKLQRPVIVEDTSMIFNSFGRLPGTMIKWFLEELGVDGLTKILNSYSDRSAQAGAAIAYFDGKNLEIFENKLLGTIAKEPRGDSGFGWNVIFIPEGFDITMGEMDDKTFSTVYKQVKPFDKLANFLHSIDKA